MPGDLRPSVLAVDANETVTDLAPLAARVADVGLPGRAAAVATMSDA
ncbi:hypothetical protein [Streptomyces viridochromogenes]|uniref:Putative Dehalogenase n=1 Tax=Streptomyces viridochromogenes Tue57 TaxID=1160705 RepID=L8P010_STRVR|nr:hypothetical protein [Streptomyces viridochromogenes]ELS50896.1 putative Dehalogenase [Streptomyces viridochromogenes Tue57]